MYLYPSYPGCYFPCIIQNREYHMIQIIRRTSHAKINQKWHEHFTKLDKMVTENRKGSLRPSLDPLQSQRLLFRVINEEAVNEGFIQTILRHTERPVLIVGFILPSKILRKCYETVIGHLDVEMAPRILFGTFVEENSSIPCNALYLFMTEDSELSKGKPEFQQKLLYGLSILWVTTESFAHKRCSYWESREEVFQKKSNLMILRERNTQIEEQYVQKFQSLFWNVTYLRSEDFDYTPKQTPNELTVKTAYRQPYRELAEQVRQQSNFELLFQQCWRIALKASYKYTTSIFCIPIVYFLYAWMKQEQRSQKQLIELSLNAYRNNVEEEFLRFLDNIHLPIDELKLRASAKSEKKQLLMNFQKQLTLFDCLFKPTDLFPKSREHLTRFLSQREQAIYHKNTQVATAYNSQLLERLYSDIILNKFEEGGESDRTYSDYKSDFRALLDCYGSESVRVSTQLKTFNEFIMKRKIEYAKNLERELQGNKRRYVISEKEELKDRLEIQMGVLYTLEQQIEQLQERRMAIELQNQALKKSITEIRNKGTNKQIASNSPMSKKKNLNSETRTLRKEFKPSRASKLYLEKQHKSSCCCSCCEVM